MSEAILKYEQVEKKFFGVRVLTDVNFSLAEGRILGLVGENGAGKSTLMNILGGVVPADGGTIRLEGQPYTPQSPVEAFRSGIAFIHQELNLFTNLSIAENLFINALPTRRRGGLPFIDRSEMHERARRLLDEVGLPLRPETLVEDLSPGERQLVEIAKALGANARIIIFDEPTTSLTSRETETLFRLIGRLREQGISMVYISHILEDVLRLCDDVLVLRDGRVVGAGPVGDFSVENMISLMVGRSIEQLFPPRISAPSEEVVLEVEGLSQPGIVENIGFALHKGEVLGVAGLMGSGRTELARILFGVDPFERGEIRLGDEALTRSSPLDRIRRSMALLTENRREEGLMMEAGIADNVSLVALRSLARRLGLVDRQRVRQAVEEVTGTVRLQCTSIDQQAARTLSGGNQQKLVLAKWLVERPAVIILDEPTRGIDVGAKHEIYRIINQLAADGTGVLFISSEIEELIGMCDRILVMKNGEICDRIERPDFEQERILRASLGETSIQ